MRTEACLGRIGCLAVALAASALLFTNPGSAWAEPSTSSSADSTSASSSGEAGADTPDSGAAGIDPTSTDPSTASDPERSEGAAGDDEEDSTITADAESDEPTDESTTTRAPDAPSNRKARSDSANETTIRRESESTATSVAVSDDSASETRIDATQRISTARQTISVAPSPAARVATASLDQPEPPAPARAVNPIALVTNVVRNFLNPLAATGTPGPPFGIPAVWSVLAFVRREFATLFASPPAADKPASLPTTSQAAEVEQRTLVLTAFPAEADAILARTTLDSDSTVVVDGRHFYLGTMGGKKVIVAMTGIGMVNATQTTEAALAHFTPESGTSINGVVFAGVAGGSGRTEIGSVAIPARWTSDDGETWHAVDDDMLAAAGGLTVDLDSIARLGDPACLCSALARLPLVDLKREPQLFVGGDGSSGDNNNGTAFPAIPFGGDVFGPQPCTAPDRSPLFFGNFFQAVVPFLASGLLTNLTGLLTDVPPAIDAVDMETAAAQQVADAHGIPFLGIRGMSDGPGDPLNLPGYPFTFFVYKQVAADNAAIVTEAFLHEWDATH